jgi:hypothetical protein
VRSEAHELQIIGVRFAIDENQVGFDMAVAAVVPFAAEGMVAVMGRQGDIGREQRDRRHLVELLAKLPRLARSFAFVIALELVGVLNLPHSAFLADSPVHPP